LAAHSKDPAKVEWFRITPFLGMHVLCLAPLWVGWSWFALGVAALLYFFRMFAITGFYHRYFSHKTFKTSRAGQFVLGVWGNSAVQRGPLWWAAHHRHHHVHSDDEDDVHSPRQHGFWWSHMFWFTNRRNFDTDLNAVPDLAKFPELRFLDRYDYVVPILLGAAMYLFGAAVEHWAPGLHTTALQILVWGFVISTVVLFHGTCTINSLAHLMGGRRFETSDDSRNSFLLSLITLGEGWHNNHHHYCASVRQGFYWWEIDITYYMLVVCSWCGLIWDLQPVPERVYTRLNANESLIAQHSHPPTA
jgi:stearoyl-CoA desaturase (delta-9 desaturase)